VDGLAGAVGAGLASKLSKLRRISKLRDIAESRGLKNMGRKGYTETWKDLERGVERLEIKFEPGKSPGLQSGSRVPRFEYRVETSPSKFWDPFTGQTGPAGPLSHVPLEPFNPWGSGAAGGVAGGVAQGAQDYFGW
jgi:hypothetical protein